MDRIRVSAVCLNQTPLDFKGNTDRIIEFINRSKDQGAQVICFPELTITGYNCEDMFLSLETVRDSIRSLKKIIPETEGVVVTLGLPLYFRELYIIVQSFFKMAKYWESNLRLNFLERVCITNQDGFRHGRLEK